MSGIETGTLVAIIAAAASTAVSTTATVYTAKQKQDEYEQQAKIQEAEAKFAQEESARQARLSEEAAAEEARVAEREGKKKLAAQKAAYGAAGVSYQGTPVLVGQEDEEELARQLANIRKWGAEEAYGWRTKGARDVRSYRSEAALKRMYGQQAWRAGLWGAGSNLLGGTSDTFDIYRKK